MKTEEQNKEYEEILDEFRARSEKSKEISKRMNSKKVILTTVVGSMIGGAIVGEYEILAHGAQAIMPFVTAGCGALGGAVASGIAALATKEQAKIDKQMLDEAEKERSR